MLDRVNRVVIDRSFRGTENKDTIQNVRENDSDFRPLVECQLSPRAKLFGLSIQVESHNKSVASILVMRSDNSCDNPLTNMIKSFIKQEL